MRNVANKLKLMIIMLLTISSLLSACSVIPYISPNSAKISDVLNDATWPPSVPVPIYLDKFMFKSLTPDDECADLYFLDVTKSEVKAYVSALRSTGFKLTPVVVVPDGFESLGKERAARGDYDYYQAEKGSLRLDVSAKPNAYGDAYIQIWGLSEADIAALKVQTEQEEIAELGGYEAVGSGISKEIRTVDISDSLDGHIQPEIVASNPYWLPALPAPAFIDRVSTSSGGARQSFEGVGFAFSFDEIDMQEIIDYWLLLKSKGYKIVQPFYAHFYYENAKPHGALDYHNYMELQAWSGPYDGGNEIRVEIGQYRLTFALSRFYIARDLYEGDDAHSALFQNDEPVGFTLDVTGLSEEDMKALGFTLYVYGDGLSSYVQSPEEIPGEPEEINHSPYTSEQVSDLMTFAHMNLYITIDELGDLLFLFSDGNIDKILEHDGIKKALEHEGVKQALEDGEWLYTIIPR